MKSLTVFAFERLCVLTFIPCSGSLCSIQYPGSSGGARGELGGYSTPSEASSHPVGRNFGSRPRKFGKITHEKTIFQSF